MIDERVKQTSCRSSALETFDKNYKELNTSINNVKDLMEADKWKRVDDIALNCEWISDVDIDNDTKWKENENYTKQDMENLMFIELFNAYYEHNNMTSDDDLVKYKTKDMIKRLKKASGDCSAFNRSHKNMLKKFEELTEENKTVLDKFALFRNETAAEFELRPVTTCD